MIERNKKGSAFNFPVGTDYDAIAAHLNGHYADKLRSPVGWYGTATANIAGDETRPEQRVKFARTTQGWEVYTHAGTISDRVTVETGKFVPVAAAAPAVPQAETVPVPPVPAAKPPKSKK